MKTKHVNVKVEHKKSFLKLFSAAFVLTGMVLPAVSQNSFLPDPEGEITFGVEEPPKIEVAPLDPVYARRLSAAERRKADNEAALRRLNDAMIVSSERQNVLAESVAALDKDRTTLVDQLIATARSIQILEDALNDTERRLLNLSDEETRIKKSLSGRRAVLTDVLAALQRMGQNPPPAIFVSANDALDSVRSAILLGSVLPELRSEAEALIVDLKSLDAVAKGTRAERGQLVKQEVQLSEEQLRLDLLIKENQKLKVTSDEELSVERQNADTLVADATNLRDLIKDISSEIVNATNDATEARGSAEREAANRLAAFEAERKRELEALKDLHPAEAAEPDSAGSQEGVVLAYRNPLDVRDNAPSQVVDYSSFSKDISLSKQTTSFVETIGFLPFPARGVTLADYGKADGLGGISEGVTVETRAQAPVIAPVDGKIVFAGKFSGFEQLLIIDVGGGYHIVLAGMDSINVKVGDHVVAREPVAVMGGKRLARLAGLATDVAGSLGDNFSGSQTQPVLYVEFRKDGKSINSNPWWEKS